MNLKTSPIRPRLFSLLMILSLLVQAGLPTPALAAQQAAPVETGPALPPGAPFVDCASVTEIPVSECDALLALHAATDGANWITRTGWLETDTPCSWFGVTCTGGFVTALSLYGNNLTGTIPASLAGLSQLTELDLGNNLLNGSIPPELGNLPDLQNLYLHENNLTGGIPSELGALTNLRQLFLKTNYLSGPIPAELGQLTLLQTLDLSQNELTGGIPVELGALTALQELYLESNLLSGSIPTEIGALVNLQTLWLYSNELSGEFPHDIVNLTQLTNFRFDCQLTSSDPEVIAFIDAIVPDWQNDICLPEGSVVTISGNAGTAGVVLHYFDNTQKTFTANGNGDYAFEVSYGWTGMVIPHLDGYTFTPGCRDYEFDPVNGNRINQNYNASNLPPASDTPGNTTRASVDSNSLQGNCASTWISLSADGRYAAFASYADNLTPNDTNGMADVFVRDMQTGLTTRVSVASDGAQGNGHSGPATFNENYRSGPSISADGRYVAFNSEASNLVADDTNNLTDVFIHDRVTGATTRVSVNSSGTEGDNYSYQPTVSADGRYVAFNSSASNLVGDDTNSRSDVFLHDRQTGVTTRVSVGSDGTQGNRDSGSWPPGLSADSRYVLFGSWASNLTDGDTNNLGDIFIRDRQTGQTHLVSTDSNGVQGNGVSYRPSISADGRFIAFASSSTNFVSQPTGNINTFWRDLQTGETRLVSLASDGLTGTGPSISFSISGDGRYVAFDSFSSGVVTNDTNDHQDVFVRDMQTEVTTRVSVDSNGGQANDESYWVVLSADGRYVAFTSHASNLVPTDTNGARDVFIVDHGALTDPPAAFHKTSPADLSNDQSTSPTLSWEDSFGAARYEYCYYTAPAIGCAAWNNNGAAASVPLSGLTPGATYFWQVRAVNIGGVTYADDNAAWSFTIPCYSLSTGVSPLGGGSVDANPAPNCNGGTQYTHGTVVTLTAQAAVGFGFNSWSGDASGSINPTTVTMTAGRSVTANFDQTCFTLSTGVNPLGSGTVEASPAPNCPGDTGRYAAGTQVTLTAAPNTGYAFSSWSGGASGTTNPLVFNLSSDLTLTANFDEQCYSLSTGVSPADGGSVDASPAPNCASVPGKYRGGTTVTLTANPSATYAFSSWSGDASGSANPTTVNMSADRSVTAVFSEVCYALTSTVSPAGSGTVEASPAPNCVSNPAKYVTGTTVTLTASPNSGYGFSSWSGDSSGTVNPATVLMSADRSVTANFSLLCYSLNASASPSAGGSVHASPAPNCNGGTQYTHGTTVTLTAAPNTGYVFSSWGGDASGSANPTTVSMTAARSVTANFGQACYSLNVSANPSAGGSVHASPAPNCNGGTQYAHGTLVTLTASPNAGYNFSSWSGDASGSANPTTVSMTAARSVVTNFTANGSVVVTSIVRTYEDPTSQFRVEYQVTFSKPVKGVDVSDFVLTTYGLTRARISRFDAIDGIYTVTIVTGDGNGALRLDLVDDDSITDKAGNPLGGPGPGNGNFTSGEIYTVIKAPSFQDVEYTHWAWQYVESLKNAGVTSGCRTEPAYFCPNINVTRDQMAVFLLRAKYGAAYTPPAATGALFADVPSAYWAAAWIEQLSREGISGGCGSGNFCPGGLVTRDQMAVFLLRAKYGAAYTPPPATGLFTDVPTSHWAAAWIEQLSREGITSGCGGGNFCPGSAVNRAQLSVFLVKMFDLPLLGELP